jgi:tetratricopeptide (TPR) repeat protein
MLGLSPSQVRAFAGLLAPKRGTRGQYLFSFQDLVLLRTAKALKQAEVSTIRIRRALEKLRRQLPEGRPLTGVHIGAEGNRIVVRDGRTRWQPESGQALFDFAVETLERKAARVDDRNVARLEDRRGNGHAGAHAGDHRDLDTLFTTAAHAEDDSPTKAMALYSRVIELDPAHADALINLGRLHHERAELDIAVTLYRRALEARPGDATAAFNLGVALEDGGDQEGAERAYRHTIVLESTYADAHYNLACLYERCGQHVQALRHLRAYRDLTRS